MTQGPRRTSSSATTLSSTQRTTKRGFCGRAAVWLLSRLFLPFDLLSNSVSEFDRIVVEAANESERLVNQLSQKRASRTRPEKGSSSGTISS